jgi:uroporphyrinogen III methyltransferase / synthase
MPVSGKVYLVGAGPGDPRLITVKGAECLRRADVVLYDALASERLLRLAPAQATRLLVGKRHGRVTVEQEEIERLIVEHARAGRNVVRLKGGDPFIFGRGGEEAEACRAAGVAFEVIPGVTSAIAGPAYAGIPLTHRDYASSVTFVTGQPGGAHEVPEADWGALVRSRATIVFLMGALLVEEISARLIAAGLDPRTPAAAIRWASTPRQRTIVTTVGAVAEKMEAERLRPPVVLVFGRVAALAGRIAWYESLPLFGRRIVITRARQQAEALAERLENYGAETLEYPTIQVADPDDPAAVERAYAAIADYDWLVLTSANGAERFFHGYLAGGRDIRGLHGVRIAAIGPATRGAIERYGVRVAVEPAQYRAEALVEALGAVAGSRILLARAQHAREVLPSVLRERGAVVDVLALYRTVLPHEVPPVDAILAADMITFTSASTVDNFLSAAGASGRSLLRRIAIAAIGPITAGALERVGVAADVVADPYTIDALVDAIVDYFANREALK